MRAIKLNDRYIKQGMLLIKIHPNIIATRSKEVEYVLSGEFDSQEFNLEDYIFNDKKSNDDKSNGD